MIWLFSDEKNFSQDQVYIRQTHRWITSCPKDVPKVMKTQFPATVMVFRDVIPPYIFDSSLRANRDIYLDVMDQVVMP
ncbi:Uncharacterized protein FKW44_015655 [Caligus rogercresseyi]|uniref:Uncharacterized protein n=1 Tax=Caligus rogercresseyi TaxID=217165 RepID=A0A7T8H0P5_CALRO|nr:Uncharacterized protein FKW44_015655 [Caligus rogercresseyi]